ncbi:MAG: hypothetical protein KF860_15845 [Cyclobacteriaceae bacterium]|nr:hypothetical protein [Cyclobacteriaceae bacterium]
MNKIKPLLHKALALSPVIYWCFYAIRYYFQIRGASRLIIITTPGHVGSSTLYQSLKGLPWKKNTRVYDFHSLDEHFNNKSEIPSRSARHVLQDVFRLMIKRNALRDKEVFVLTLIRDPLARALGGMFQGKGIFLGDLNVGNLEERQYPSYCDKIKELLVSGYLENTTNWQFKFYRTELKKYWNFNVDTISFEHGYGIQKGDQGSLIVFTLESLNGSLAQVMEDQFSVSPQVIIANTNSSDFYNYCKLNVKLKNDWLQKIYAEPLLAKAYGSQKISQLVSDWSLENTK